jgi:hypothetical protein
MHRHTFALALILSTALTLGACGGGGGGSGGSDGGGDTGEYGISHSGSTRSHNAGENCMSCHKTGGTGDGVFSVAGTVYNGSSPAASGTVYLYADKAQTMLITTLEVDAYGNFYTIDTVAELTDSGAGIAGVYAKVNGSTMPGVVSNGSCNECHSPAGGVGRI